MSIDEAVHSDQDAAPAAQHPERAAAQLAPAVGAGVVFVASAAVLVLEIAAMRLVAPYVGVTLQTSSAVIGTALLAMAAGAWTGGRLADRVGERLIAPALVVGGLLTILTVPIVRQVGGWVAGRPLVPSVLLMAALAVLAPSAVLSSVSPMVVRSQLADLHRSGSVVGRLSGIGTLGAITATFLTGFVLLATVRTSHILIGTGALLVALGGGLAMTSPGRRPALRALAVVPLTPWLFVASPGACQFETTYHCANVVAVDGTDSIRELHLDTLNHSAVDLQDPRDLKFEYATAVASVIDAVRRPGTPVEGLWVGAGGLTLPRYVAATRPGSRATAIEIDPGVVRLTREYLGGDDIPNLAVQVGDARTLVRQADAGRYDLVMGDAFAGLAAPWHLATVEAVRDVKAALKPDGAYVVNVIDFPPDRFARAQLATLRQVFAHVVIVAPPGVLAGSVAGNGNHVILATDAPVDLDTIAAGLRRWGRGWTLLDEAATRAFAGDARPLTDDFAPVDQLLTPLPRA